MARILTTLAGIPFFQSGVGDNADLLLRVREDMDGGWFPVIHKGFYYIGTEEAYLFASKGTLSFTETVANQIRTQLVTGLLEDPTRKGPIILKKSGSARPLQRVSSPLRAFREITFTGSGEVQQATVPGLLVQLCTDPVTGILLQVPTTGDIFSTEDFVYEVRTGRLFIRNPQLPRMYATYVVGAADPDLLRQEEIVKIDTDGKARVQFATVSLASGFVPIIRKPTAAGTVTCTGTVVERNAITFAPSGLIHPGDIVAVQYYVQDSYTATASGMDRFSVRYFVSATGSYELEYETGLSDWYDTSQLASGSVNYLQMNPIFEPRMDGFIYLVDPSEAWPTPAKIRITASNLNPLYSPSGCATVKIAVTVLDQENEPIPEQRITVSASGTSGFLTLAYQKEHRTNGIGQVLYNYTMAGTGLVIISAAVSGTPSTSGSLMFRVRHMDAYTHPVEQRLGKLLFHMEDEPFRDGLFRLNAYYCYPDGAPFQASGAVAASPFTVVFSSEKSPFFTLDGLPVGKPVSVNTNDDSIASILVRPLPDDTLRAVVTTASAGRVREARPIRIPPEHVTTE